MTTEQLEAPAWVTETARARDILRKAKERQEREAAERAGQEAIAAFRPRLEAALPDADEVRVVKWMYESGIAGGQIHLGNGVVVNIWDDSHNYGNPQNCRLCPPKGGAPYLVVELDQISLSFALLQYYEHFAEAIAKEKQAEEHRAQLLAEQEVRNARQQKESAKERARQCEFDALLPAAESRLHRLAHQVNQDDCDDWGKAPGSNECGFDVWSRLGVDRPALYSRPLDVIPLEGLPAAMDELVKLAEKKGRAILILRAQAAELEKLAEPVTVYRISYPTGAVDDGEACTAWIYCLSPDRDAEGWYQAIDGDQARPVRLELWRPGTIVTEELLFTETACLPHELTVRETLRLDGCEQSVTRPSRLLLPGNKGAV